ncbi:uncharacterized protein BXIN_1341 [Babesia sp. Xinjiang]|uniref:uncharacterized protein n=1 Tax=Babesia sp. Xinjiang TaxID=462227 RepID=UPI000A222651|nr:uncharacterized protein BXIN_1341 [Babesia sp. Xinjiang]ORM39893.1 hypothetical protein BXIN_1341 [Babesia sp. Xinjiang]
MAEEVCCVKRAEAIRGMLGWYYRDNVGNTYGPVDSFRVLYFIYANYFEENTPFAPVRRGRMMHSGFDDLKKYLPMLEDDFLQYSDVVFSCRHYMEDLLDGTGDIVDTKIPCVERAAVKNSSNDSIGLRKVITGVLDVRSTDAGFEANHYNTDFDETHYFGDSKPQYPVISRRQDVTSDLLASKDTIQPPQLDIYSHSDGMDGSAEYPDSGVETSRVREGLHADVAIPMRLETVALPHSMDMDFASIEPYGNGTSTAHQVDVSTSDPPTLGSQPQYYTAQAWTLGSLNGVKANDNVNQSTLGTVTPPPLASYLGDTRSDRHSGGTLSEDSHIGSPTDSGELSHIAIAPPKLYEWMDTRNPKSRYGGSANDERDGYGRPGVDNVNDWRRYRSQADAAVRNPVGDTQYKHSRSDGTGTLLQHNRVASDRLAESNYRDNRYMPPPPPPKPNRDVSDMTLSNDSDETFYGADGMRILHRSNQLMPAHQMLIKQRLQNNLRETEAHLSRLSSRKLSHMLSKSHGELFMGASRGSNL